MYCICCKKDKITNYSDDNLSEEDFLWSVEEKKLDKSQAKHFGTNALTISVSNRMSSGGVIDIIDAGYGSAHDGDKLIIAICDDCITRELEDGTLLYHSNYMMNYVSVKDDVKKSKLIYRRRKNLDNIIPPLDI